MSSTKVSPVSTAIMRLLALPSGVVLEHGATRKPASAFVEGASMVSEDASMDEEMKSR